MDSLLNIWSPVEKVIDFLFPDFMVKLRIELMSLWNAKVGLYQDIRGIRMLVVVEYVRNKIEEDCNAA